MVRSGVTRGGQRREEQEAETVCVGGGHSGVVFVLLLESGAFVFNNIVNRMFCRSQKLIATTIFLVGISMPYRFVISGLSVVLSTDANVIETVSYLKEVGKEDVDGFKLEPGIIT